MKFHHMQLGGRDEDENENENENESENERERIKRKEHILNQHPIPFLLSSVSCKEGRIPVTRRHPTHPDDKKKHPFHLFYRLFRPSFLHQHPHHPAPLVVLHGGPGLPSDYLHPLVDVLPRRPILFFDQLGCGRSDSPVDLAYYSIADSVNDLRVLLASLSISRFHLYGHSYGGILVYEYLKQSRCCEGETLVPPSPRQCLSAILSSTPSNIPMCDRHSEQLEQSLRKHESDDEVTLQRRFRHKHLCRMGTSDDTDDVPPPLRDAFDHLGAVWCGMAVVKDYVATAAAAGDMPPVLLLRGEFDFVEERCGLDGWRRIWKDSSEGEVSVTTVTLGGCSHMAVLENGGLYGRTLESFLSNFD